jgi:phosphoribosyl-AMP cyclohydrolase
MQEILNRVDWEKSELLPVIVQDETTNEVLMMAYMNREALQLSLETKLAPSSVSGKKVKAQTTFSISALL